MSKSKTISLRGKAAGTFMRMHAGKEATSTDEVLERLAVMVHMNVQNNDLPKAVVLLKEALAKGVA